ncbi:3'5'-cyclic nucleotide phosphodiesterase domain-containing protein, partial [Cardiosporidium cionae]
VNKQIGSTLYIPALLLYRIESIDDHCVSAWPIGGREECSGKDIPSTHANDFSSETFSVNPPPSLSPQSTVTAWQSTITLQHPSLPPALSLPPGNSSKKKLKGGVRFSLPFQKKMPRFPASSSTPSSHSPLHFDAPFQAAPLWRLLAPFSLRFKREKMESMFAEFVQAQISKNLWWSLFVLSFCVMAEYFLTAMSTVNFKPFNQPAHFLYTLGALIIVIGGLMISLLSRQQFFEPYLEACVAVFGTVFAALMVFTSDHYRVASILGFDAASAWGRESFSDAPLLLGLNAILWAIAIFLPVRSVCLWPVCLSAVISYQFATFVCGGPDGLRPSLLNIFLLILLSYLALIGRRALEAQLRLQFVEVHRTACKIESLEQKISQYQQPPSTTLEWIFNSLRDASTRLDYVRSVISDDYPEMATVLCSSGKNLRTSLAQLSRIDSLLSVNLNAILGKSGKTCSNYLNDSTKMFIRSTFSRPSDRAAEFANDDLPSKGSTNHEIVSPKMYYEGIKFSILVAPRGDSYYTIFDGIGTNWNYDILFLEKETKGQALMMVGSYLLQLYGNSYLQCDRQDIMHFVSEIQQRYEANPYHNSMHGADVCHSALFLLQALDIFDKMDFLEQLSVIVATLCHDVAHPGKNNSFLAATANEIAVIYNDQSVLEQFHSAQTFQALRTNGCNFTHNLPSEEFTRFRHGVIDLILETDMSKHFESIAKFKLRRQNDGFSIRQRREDRWHTVRMCVKAADISHSAKSWDLHCFWSLQCVEEFFVQGDEEKRLGLPISPLCDRQKAYEIPKSQVGFLQLVCLSLFQELQVVEEMTSASSYEETSHVAHTSSSYPSTPLPPSFSLLPQSSSTLPLTPVFHPGAASYFSYSPYSSPPPQRSNKETLHLLPMRELAFLPESGYPLASLPHESISEESVAPNLLVTAKKTEKGRWHEKATFRSPPSLNNNSSLPSLEGGELREGSPPAIARLPALKQLSPLQSPLVPSTSFGNKNDRRFVTFAGETAVCTGVCTSPVHLKEYRSEDYVLPSTMAQRPLFSRNLNLSDTYCSKADYQIGKWCVEQLEENKRLWEDYAEAFEDIAESENSSEFFIEVLRQLASNCNCPHQPNGEHEADETSNLSGVGVH